jgi:uncharacterized protein (DUF58 family)
MSAPSFTAPAWLRRLRRRHAESGPVRLDRRRVYIFPTYAGLFYAATLAAMHLGSINYDLALGHALVFLLISLGLVSMLHSYRTLLGLEILPLGNDPVFAGEAAHFRFCIRNTAFAFPRPGLEWHCGDEPVRIQHVPAREDAILTLSLPALRRGWLSLPPLKVASRYPIGMFLTWAYPWPEARCLVYPRPCFTPLPQTLDAGEAAGLREEGHEDFLGFRERQPADSYRHVAWKAAARDPDTPLLVKVFGSGSGTQLRLCWQDTRGDLEERLSILTGWVLAAEAAGRRYGLALPDQEIPLGHGPAHRDHCLRSLALHPGAA